MNRRLSLTVISIMAGAISMCAQHFRWEVPVDPVPVPGYTRILLQPEVASETRDPFLDVRIYDSDSTEIPFLGVYDPVVKEREWFMEYPIVDKSDQPANCWITVKNPLHASDKLNHLVLEVNNASASRKMTLTGSYDNQNWYAVKDEFTTTYYETPGGGMEVTTNLIRFDFPYSDYAYYRFTFDNWSAWWKDYQAPVFVVRAGILVNVNAEPVQDNYIKLPGVTVTQNENKQLKMTQVDILFADSQLVDVLRFNFSTTNPAGRFQRGARLYELSVDTGPAGNDAPKETLLSSAVISSGGFNEFAVRAKVKHLVLRIANEDDQPVSVDSVHALQVKHYLLAYLQPSEHYFLRYGNDSILHASYDLRYLEDSLATRETPVVGTGPKTRLPELPAPVQPSGVNSFFADSRVIWASMTLVVLLLGLMSVKMLREMRRK